VDVDTDVVPATSSRAMHGLLDAPGEPPGDGEPLPPLWHWMAFLPRLARREMGNDGHPLRARALYFEEFPRRMFAGARLSFPGVARVGETLTRRSRVTSVERKTGRSGELLFVTMTTEVSNEEGIAIVEEQDIVYRSAAPANGAAPFNVEEWPWQIELPTDPVTLFRYSALTYNAHRIHYDRDYANREEGYPGLVVQGPLQAVGLAEVARRFVPDRRVSVFRFRAKRPAFDGPALRLCGRLDDSGLALAALDVSTNETVTAHVSWLD
jgi:3-methylfumaryl-CoA hydratase